MSVYIKLLSLEGSNLTFETDMNFSQLNSFRRALVAKVPVVAIDLIQIIENDSYIVNEVMCERLSSIPIKYVRHEDLVRKDLCDCNLICKQCSFLISFNGIEAEKDICLMSQDISPFMLENIPVVNLYKGQKLKFNLVCTRSVAAEHAKWSLGVVCRIARYSENDNLEKYLETSQFKVTLHNTGVYTFGYILRQACLIMRSGNIFIDIK